jgi:hypothetical protein
MFSKICGLLVDYFHCLIQISAVHKDNLRGLIFFSSQTFPQKEQWTVKFQSRVPEASCNICGKHGEINEVLKTVTELKLSIFFLPTTFLYKTLTISNCHIWRLSRKKWDNKASLFSYKLNSSQS